MKYVISVCVGFFIMMKLSFGQLPFTLELNQNWEFRKFGDSSGWMKATVPGCVHTDLIANEVIPDPFYGNNEKLVQWVEREDWEYKTSFNIKRKVSKKEHINITLSGLDTYADVYLNDSLILQADNMFIEWQVEIQNILKKGENNLYIRFYSPVKRGKELMQNYPIALPGGERVFTRKAQYQYGWDWGPRLLTCGIWKPIVIKASDDETAIGNITVHQGKIANDSILIDFILDGKLDKLKIGNENYYLQIINKITGEILIHTIQNQTQEGLHLQFYIHNPQLWWCNDLGEQNLYSFTVFLSHKNVIIDSAETTFAIRDVQLKQIADSSGSGFTFILNGKPIFAKGANYIPLNSFPTALKKQDYRNLLIEAKNMHMNMIRVWGGGIYEDDYFYQLCDSLGILVWQDYMFACAMYPFHDNVNSYVQEVNYQNKRINKNGSVALWCGNNENYEGWFNWSWQKEFNYSAADSIQIWRQNQEFFEGTIPFQTRSKSNTNYHPSSPTFGWGHAESLLQGDCHYWGVWWGLEPFDTYNYKISRFMSEYGFQGMPSYRSFLKFIPQNELSLNSASVKNHQKHPTGYETIDTYLQRDYIKPQNFEDYIYVSQLLQARGMQIAIEAHRRNMPYCMGTLYWQLNDCWPVTSWSTLDYYNNRKASYYLVKEKYQPIIVSIFNEQDTIETYLINDLLESQAITIEGKLMTTSGKIISTFNESLVLAPMSSTLYAKFPKFILLGGLHPNECIYSVLIKQKGGVIAEEIYNFVPPKDMVLQSPHFEYSFDAERQIIRITSQVYTKDVYLFTTENELKLSENYFDLLPSETKEIYLQEVAPTDLQEKLRIKCLNTLYNE